MTAPLSSIETEYALAALDPSGQRVPAGTVHERFVAALRSNYPWLAASEGGFFLGNGARVYWDAGAHPEYAAPECAGHPRELVAHVRAGHAIMAALGREIERDRQIRSLTIWRGNVDYVTQDSWGCHENYLTWKSASTLAPRIAAHLASRVIYGGAGGWATDAHDRFSLSPRLELFTEYTSEDTMHVRGIINTRNEPHAAAGHRRLHLICRDNVCAPLADLLSIGMTRLVVTLADNGLLDELTLDQPVAAMQTFCRDVSCRRTVATSRGPMTAIDIQRWLVDEISRANEHLPDWSEEIAGRCSGVLDRLAADPMELVGKLDWPTKRAIFDNSGCRNQHELLMLDMLLSDLSCTEMADLFADGQTDVVTVADIEAAIAQAPESTRAGVRGNVVKRMSGRQRAYCSWTEIYADNKRLDLSEPFETTERWVDAETPVRV